MPAEAVEAPPPSPWKLFSEASFEVGGEDQIASIRLKHHTEPTDEAGRNGFEREWREFLAKVQIRTGTLLKTDMVSFLLGAGASKECGGVLIGKVPKEVEQKLLQAGAGSGRVRRWLRAFYMAVAQTNNNAALIPITREEILDRYTAIISGEAEEFPINYELLLGLLYRWRAAISQQNQRLRLDGSPSINVDAAELDECLRQATRALAEMCYLPTGDRAQGLRTYETLCRKILTRPLNLKRVNIFTLNYDTLIEQASDAAGIVLVDGFVGTLRRIYRPECYDQDLYFPAQTTEGRVHRLDRVAHLYKLHGSITWTAERPSWDNPFGIVSGCDASNADRMLIYPTPAKFGDTLGMPYAELFRRFASNVVRPQSTLFVLGYGFGDEHVNAIIHQALAIPSFTLVIVDPAPVSEYVQRLKAQRDRRVWIFSGMTFGAFGGFVEHVLPDLQDEEIMRKVITTFRALGTRVSETDQEHSDAL